MFQLSDLFPLNSVTMSAFWLRPNPLQSISIAVSAFRLRHTPAPVRADVILKRSLTIEHCLMNSLIIYLKQLKCNSRIKFHLVLESNLHS